MACNQLGADAPTDKVLVGTEHQGADRLWNGRSEPENHENRSTGFSWMQFTERNLRMLRWKSMSGRGLMAAVKIHTRVGVLWLVEAKSLDQKNFSRYEEFLRQIPEETGVCDADAFAVARSEIEGVLIS